MITALLLARPTDGQTLLHYAEEPTDGLTDGQTKRVTKLPIRDYKNKS